MVIQTDFTFPKVRVNKSMADFGNLLLKSWVWFWPASLDRLVLVGVRGLVSKNSSWRAFCEVLEGSPWVPVQLIHQSRKKGSC